MVGVWTPASATADGLPGQPIEARITPGDVVLLSTTAVLGVRFRPYGTMHLLRVNDDHGFRHGDQVLYPTEGGPAVATVVWCGEAPDGSDLPRCLGPATSADQAKVSADQARRAEIEVVVRELIERHELPMKVLAVDQQHPDGAQPLAVVYYTAPSRVDFRALLGDLGRVLQSRIDLRQVGDRDAARLVCDVGACGRQSCCTACMTSLEPTHRQLRSGSSLTTGNCGRALCCLRFADPNPQENQRGQW